MNPQNPLFLRRKTLTLTCPQLDRFLSGGIPCNTITEIAGEFGSGKTQLCLQLLLSSQLPHSHGGLAASSLYLHTELPFPVRRLAQLSKSFIAANAGIFPPEYDPLGRIFVGKIESADELVDVLLKLDSVIEGVRVGKWPIKLIVVDSIAALFRGEYENKGGEMRKRAALFFRISGRLRSLAERYGIVVVVTNQVVDLVEGGDGRGSGGVRVGNEEVLVSLGRRVCPALGLSWANCVNVRLFLSKSEVSVDDKKEGGFVDEDGGGRFIRRCTRRRIHVVFAPHLPPSSCEFEIVREGVFGVNR
ncbi:hypothetical protein Droror1_Dr00005720 [Drosera rotundifolia]